MYAMVTLGSIKLICRKISTCVICALRALYHMREKKIGIKQQSENSLRRLRYHIQNGLVSAFNCTVNINRIRISAQCPC